MTLIELVQGNLGEVPFDVRDRDAGGIDIDGTATTNRETGGASGDGSHVAG